MIRFDSVAAVNTHRDDLLDIVDAWCSMTEPRPRDR
jgi:hypothetical protein